MGYWTKITIRNSCQHSYKKYETIRSGKLQIRTCLKCGKEKLYYV